MGASEIRLLDTDRAANMLMLHSGKSKSSWQDVADSQEL